MQIDCGKQYTVAAREETSSEENEGYKMRGIDY
jgi:hypothetical protein